MVSVNSIHAPLKKKTCVALATVAEAMSMCKLIVPLTVMTDVKSNYSIHPHTYMYIYDVTVVLDVTYITG